MKIFLSVAVVLLLAVPAFAGNPDDVLGLWRTDDDDSKIELYKCGEDVCGKVAWLKDLKSSRSEDGPIGEVKSDWKNPDPSLRKRTLLGLRVIEGFTYVGDFKWEKGLCYDPESGNTYKCNMEYIPPDKVDLRGFIGFYFIGRTYTFTR